MTRLVSAFIVLFSSLAQGSATYTVKELKSMAAKNKYPRIKKTGEDSSTIDFQYCKPFATDEMNEADEEGYPTQVVTRKKNLFVARIWRGHAMMEFVCKEGETMRTVDYEYMD